MHDTLFGCSMLMALETKLPCSEQREDDMGWEKSQYRRQHEVINLVRNPEQQAVSQDR